MAAKVERPTIEFIHYETKEVRKVAEPDKLQQISRDFITAFITSEEHYEDLPWYREMRDAELAKVIENNPGINLADAQIKAFPQVRIQFVKKYFPQFAPKERKHREKKPAKIDMWEL